MPFRVGLLFHSSPTPPADTKGIESVLRDINERTHSLRGGEPIVVVPFLRNNTELEAARAATGDCQLLGAATWSSAGIVFCDCNDLDGAYSPKSDTSTQSAGMASLLSSTHVIVVAAVKAESEMLLSSLRASQNVWALIAVVFADGEGAEFFELDPNVEKVEPVEWQLKVKKRWQMAKPDIETLGRPKRAILGMIFPWLTSAIIRERSENVRKRPPTRFERCWDGLAISASAMEKLTTADQKLLDRNLDALCPFFATHDDMGRVYSNVFRTTCFLVPVLIAGSTIVAVAAVIDQRRRGIWHIIEIVLLLMAALVAFRSKVAKHHAKWVEHRLIAELMRSSMLCDLMHTIPQLGLPTEDSRAWLHCCRTAWIYRRSLPILRFDSVRADLLSARRSAIEGYVRSQATFHERFANQHHEAHKWLNKISGYAFFLTLCLVVTQLVITYLPDMDERLPVRLMMATLAGACLAFVLSLLAHQLGFEAIAERSSSAARRFHELNLSIHQHAHNADASQVYGWAAACARIIVDEQHSWYRHIPSIRMHL